jgi:NAD(P)-dependent dehydrogenase (short-subunit alcohol dehydrogenase family)
VKLSPLPALSASARLIDILLEASIVGSFSRLGPALRGPSAHWASPTSMEDRVVVVTGATSGLGREAAHTFARLGARLCLIGRDPAKTSAVQASLEAEFGHSVDAKLADLADLAQVAKLAEGLAESYAAIDVLAHIAGGLSPEWHVTPQGRERTVAVQVLAPYLLTTTLVSNLAAGAGRVLMMTSGGMYAERFDLEHLEMQAHDYRGSVAYARAKRAQVVMTRGFQRQFGVLGISAYAPHPGWSDTPGLTAGLPTFARVLRPLLRTPAEGADTLVWLSSSQVPTAPGGRLWLDRRPRSEYRLPWTWTPPAGHQAEEEALFAWCEEIVRTLRSSGTGVADK